MVLHQLKLKLKGEDGEGVGRRAEEGEDKAYANGVGDEGDEKVESVQDEEVEKVGEEKHEVAKARA